MGWKNLCIPVKKGGLNVTNLEVWNHIALLKHLWNISVKMDNLWMKWVHAYFLKNNSIHDANIGSTTSWIL